MQGTEHVQRLAPEYAVPDDFCRIFAEEMESLFTLALLLTGEFDQAEACFAAAFESSTEQTRVFREWTDRWARRAVMQNAIRMVEPLRRREAALEHGGGGSQAELGNHRIPLAAILRLKAFERFAFVMSVLERCSDHECAVLLECSRQDLVSARSRALAQVSAMGNISGRISGVPVLFNPNLVAKTA